MAMKPMISHLITFSKLKSIARGGALPDIDMTVAADDGTPLAGTLTLPAGPSPHPAVLLLHGSGPLDRDGNTPKLVMDLARPMAEALAAAGIATLRYDRRGAGSTPGDWRASGFTDNREDAAAALRALAARPDIRSEAVGVIGHSEGALHAMALASRTDVRAAVLLAASPAWARTPSAGRAGRSSGPCPFPSGSSGVRWEHWATEP